MGRGPAGSFFPTVLVQRKEVLVMVAQLCQEIVSGLLSQMPSELVTTGIVALVAYLGRAWTRRRKLRQGDSPSAADQ